MSDFLFICGGIAILLTALSMGTGVVSMVKGEEFRKKYANKLMKARVLFQGLAIVFIFLALAASQS